MVILKTYRHQRLTVLVKDTRGVGEQHDAESSLVTETNFINVYIMYVHRVTILQVPILCSFIPMLYYFQYTTTNDTILGNNFVSVWKSYGTAVCYRFSAAVSSKA